jgi:hypothetical protein
VAKVRQELAKEQAESGKIQVSRLSPGEVVRQGIEFQEKLYISPLRIQTIYSQTLQEEPQEEAEGLHRQPGCKGCRTRQIPHTSTAQLVQRSKGLHPRCPGHGGQLSSLLYLEGGARQYP